MRPDQAAKGALTGSEIDTAVTRGNKQASASKPLMSPWSISLSARIAA
jgi:hypothetical protein